MKICLKVLKIKIFELELKIKKLLFELALMVFTIIGSLFAEKIQYEILLAPMKSLTNCEIPSRNPLHET